MFKKTLPIVAILLGFVFLLSGCNDNKKAENTQVAGVPVPSMQEKVYRGELISLQDGRLLVGQTIGFDYGYEEILFNLPQDFDTTDLKEGMYLEVRYSPAMTRSIPPQANLISVEILGDTVDSVIMNGQIESVSQLIEGDHDYRLEIIPGDLVTDCADQQNTVVLIIPIATLEGIEEADLVAGEWVSAVTAGIMTMSEPPQMPVKVLLPYTT